VKGTRVPPFYRFGVGRIGVGVAAQLASQIGDGSEDAAGYEPFRSLIGKPRIVIAMSAEIVIRRALPSENNSVQALVQAIADETFAYLFAQSQVPIGESNWLSSWLGILGEEIVGVTMTRDEWISDLWVRRDCRRIGIGGKLLAHAEREIQGRGYHTLRLRVVKSNTRAVEFYQNHGWRVQREFPHEKFGHTMFELAKSTVTLP
jgi:ribosomal protein S18 acetylase RimI-like enzyme